MSNKLKTSIFLIIPFLFCGILKAEHRFGINASNLTVGTIPPERADLSSYTMRGQLSDGTATLNVGSATFRLVVTATSGFVGGSSTFTYTTIQSIAYIGSVTIYGVVTSTSGFAGVGSSLTLLNASNLALGTIPDARLSASSATLLSQLRNNRYIIEEASATFSGTVTSTSGFAGVGSSLTLLNASNLALGTIPDARISASSATLLSQLRNNRYIIEEASATFSGTVQSTTGFIGGISTFTNLTINGVAYNFPVDNGANSQKLETNGNGVLAWGDDLAYTGVESATNSIRPYSIVIGTSATGLNTPVDIATNTQLAFEIALASLGARGGTIYVRRGDYFIRWATIPANVEVIFEASAVVKNNGDFKVFDVSGTLRNLQLYTPTPVTTSLVKLNNGARLYDTKNTFIINNTAGTAGVTAGLYDISACQNVLVDGMINGRWFSDSAAGSRYFISNATNVVIKNIIDTEVERTTGGGILDLSNPQIRLGTYMRGVEFYDCRFIVSGEHIRATGVTSAASSTFRLADSIIRIDSHDNTGQLWNFSGSTRFTTGTVFDNIHIHFTSMTEGSANNKLDYISNVSVNNKGLIYKNITITHAHEIGGAIVSDVFLQIDGDSDGHRIYNCDITHNGATFTAGTGVFKRGANNYLNNTRVTDDN